MTTASLVITVDTEPDNQWTFPSAGGAVADLTFANTRGLGRLIDFLDGEGTPGTWLTSYSVARDPESVRALRRAMQGGHEIGGHLHAWETPPFTDADRRAHPYIYEYDTAIRKAKLHAVTRALQDAFGTAPASYRAGRWGIDEMELRHLAEMGYTIDTSVVPGHDFSSSIGLARGGPDFRRRLTASPPDPYRVGSIWEAPVSAATIGALGATAAGAAMARGLAYRLDLPSRAANRLLRAAGLCGLVWVRPLVHPRGDLVRAALALVERGARLVNVMFHSSESFVGTSPRTRTAGDVERFYGDLGAIIKAVKATGRVTPRTLSQAVSS
ncbi:MAG TPA: hypothetical protein VGK94_04890 [Candidatus Polarisedimenticolia bacterium]|jgi:peptidoglycan/xylan/chitin deacetylase (PgdA/CDA1 family)